MSCVRNRVGNTRGYPVNYWFASPFLWHAVTDLPGKGYCTHIASLQKSLTFVCRGKKKKDMFKSYKITNSLGKRWWCSSCLIEFEPFFSEQ